MKTNTELLLEAVGAELSYRELERDRIPDFIKNQRLEPTPFKWRPMHVINRQISRNEKRRRQRQRRIMRAIGWRLFRSGGIDAMHQAEGAVWASFGGRGASIVDHAWNGVGGGGAWVS